MKIFILVFLFGFCLNAGAAPKAGAARYPSMHEPPSFEEKAGFNLFNPKIKTRPTGDAFGDMLAASDFVYIGGARGQKFVHMAQLEALKIMAWARKDRVIVGFEALDSSRQPLLDDYISGKLTAAQFLEKIGIEKEWGPATALYKPVFDFIRDRGLKAAALGVPNKIIAKIARAGMDGLSQGEKSLLPSAVNFNRDRLYAAFLKKSYAARGGSAAGKIKRENYELSIAAWNESMAETAVQHFKKNKGYAMLIIAGGGHVVYNGGLPFSVKARTKELVHTSIYAMDAENQDDSMKAPAPLADLVWFVRFEKKSGE